MARTMAYITSMRVICYLLLMVISLADMVIEKDILFDNQLYPFAETVTFLDSSLNHFFIAGDVKTSRKSWLVVKEAKYLRSTRFISQRGTGRKRFIRDKSLKERKNVSCKLSKSLPLSPLLSCGDQTGQSRPFNKQFFGYEFCSYSVFCTFIIDISTRFSINGLVLNTPCDSPEQITETHR